MVSLKTIFHVNPIYKTRVEPLWLKVRTEVVWDSSRAAGAPRAPHESHLSSRWHLLWEMQGMPWCLGLWFWGGRNQVGFWALTPGLVSIYQGPDAGPSEPGTTFPTLLSSQAPAAMRIRAQDKKLCQHLISNEFYSLKIRLTKLKTPTALPFCLPFQKISVFLHWTKFSVMFSVGSMLRIGSRCRGLADMAHTDIIEWTSFS